MENRDYTLIVILVIVTAVAVSAADAAGIPKKAISTVGQFLETDLPSATVFTDQNNQLTHANAVYMTNTGLVVRNPASTFATTLAGGAVTANETLNLPAITSSDTLGALGLSQTWTGTNTFNALTLGGPLNLAGNTITNTGTLTLPTSTDTLVGRATTDTLTNKAISGSSNTITNVSPTVSLVPGTGTGNQTLIVNAAGNALEYVTDAVAYKTTQTTYSTTTTSDPNLRVATAISTTYSIHAVLFTTISTASDGIGCGVSVPGTSPTVNGIAVLGFTTTTAVSEAVQTTSTTTPINPTTAGTYMMILDGTVTTGSGTAGSVAIQCVSTNTTHKATINVGSYMEVRQIDT